MAVERIHARVHIGETNGWTDRQMNNEWTKQKKKKISNPHHRLFFFFKGFKISSTFNNVKEA